MKPLTEIIIERCRELAAGADVEDREDGLCWDVLQRVNLHWPDNGQSYVRVVYPVLQNTFEALGLHPSDPLGDYHDEGDHWEGERGVRRRALAGRVAAYLQQREEQLA